MKKSKDNTNYEIIMDDSRFTAEIQLIDGSTNVVVIVRRGKSYAKKLAPSGDMEAVKAASESLRQVLIKKLKLQGDEN